MDRQRDGHSWMDRQTDRLSPEYPMKTFILQSIKNLRLVLIKGNSKHNSKPQINVTQDFVSERVKKSMEKKKSWSPAFSPFLICSLISGILSCGAAKSWDHLINGLKKINQTTMGLNFFLPSSASII